MRQVSLVIWRHSAAGSTHTASLSSLTSPSPGLTGASAAATFQPPLLPISIFAPSDEIDRLPGETPSASCVFLRSFRSKRNSVCGGPPSPTSSMSSSLRAAGAVSV